MWVERAVIGIRCWAVERRGRFPCSIGNPVLESARLSLGRPVTFGGLSCLLIDRRGSWYASRPYRASSRCLVGSFAVRLGRARSGLSRPCAAANLRDAVGESHLHRSTLVRLPARRGMGGASPPTLEICKSAVLLVEVQLYSPYWPVAVFGDDHFAYVFLALSLGSFQIIVILPVKEHYEVSRLL